MCADGGALLQWPGKKTLCIGGAVLSLREVSLGSYASFGSYRFCLPIIIYHLGKLRSIYSTYITCVIFYNVSLDLS